MLSFLGGEAARQRGRPAVSRRVASLATGGANRSADEEQAAATSTTGVSINRLK